MGARKQQANRQCRKYWMMMAAGHRTSRSGSVWIFTWRTARVKRGAVPFMSIDDRVRQHVLDRIDRPPVDPHLVMQMRTGGQSRRANQRDLLAALHALPARDQNLGAVRVPRDQTVAVVQREHVAVTFDP